MPQRVLPAEQGIVLDSLSAGYGQTLIVDNIHLTIPHGKMTVLAGANGSGKSTLMKVLCGIYPHGSYEGEIIFAGETLQANHIRDTERKGIAIIHQELALVKHLTVLENIFLGAEISRHGLLDYETMTLRCQKLLAQVNLPISPDTRVGDLGLGQQQLVEIAKALNKQVRLLILDEPSRGGGQRFLHKLGDLLMRLNRDIGLTVLIAEQHLPFIRRVADRFCLLHCGRSVAQGDVIQLDAPLLAKWMTPDPAR